jgi:hypothetical protein
MKNYTLNLFLIIITFSTILPAISAEVICKDLKTCAEWAMDKTSTKYDLGTLAKRSMKVEKDFLISEGDPDFIFNFLLISNDFARIKRENGVYQVVTARDLKNFHFTQIKEEEIPNTLDFYSVEFTFSNKLKAKNAMQIFKKYISKEGRLLEVSEAPKILVTDIGIQLQALRSIAHELNK